jgi:hypothetical protein
MLPIVTANPLVLKVEKVGKTACLGTVTGREKYLIAKLVQLTDDGTEERHMGGIVKIDPNSFLVMSVFHLTNLFKNKFEIRIFLVD